MKETAKIGMEHGAWGMGLTSLRAQLFACCSDFKYFTKSRMLNFATNSSMLHAPCRKSFLARTSVELIRHKFKLLFNELLSDKKRDGSRLGIIYW
jgi:hypothetical protein